MTKRKGTRESVQLAIDVAPELKARIANQAGAEKRSIKQVVVAALSAYLDNYELFEEAKSARKRKPKKAAKRTPRKPKEARNEQSEVL